MFRAFLILAAVLAATVAQAADRIIVVGPDGQQLADGKYWAIAIHADGTAPTVSLALEVGGVVPPPPPPVEGLTKAVVAEIEKVAANDARHAAATKLGAAYNALGGATIPAAKAVEVANAMIAMALTSAEQKMMAGVTGVVNTALAKCTTDAAVSATFREAGVACVSTVPASEKAVAQMKSDLAAADQDELKSLGERYKIDWTAFMQMVMQFITVVLPIILQFFKTATVLGQFVLLV